MARPKGIPSEKKGKTNVEIYGAEKAEEIKRKAHFAHLGHGRPKGSYPSKETRLKMSIAKKGKTAEEIWGIEGAKKRREMMHSPEFRKKVSKGREGQGAPWLIGKHPSLKSIQKNREWHKGKHTSKATEFKRGEHRSPNTEFRKGVPLPKEVIQKRTATIKKKFLDPEYAKAKLALIFPKPTQPELYLDAILQLNFPKEWGYTGDGKLWIEGKNPDFTNINGKKLLIEYNGFHTHNIEKDAAKADHYAKYGWRTLNLYPIDLKDETALLAKIKAFAA